MGWVRTARMSNQPTGQVHSYLEGRGDNMYLIWPPEKCISLLSTVTILEEYRSVLILLKIRELDWIYIRNSVRCLYLAHIGSKYSNLDLIH